MSCDTCVEEIAFTVFDGRIGNHPGGIEVRSISPIKACGSSQRHHLAVIFGTIALILVRIIHVDRIGWEMDRQKIVVTFTSIGTETVLELGHIRNGLALNCRSEIH